MSIIIINGIGIDNKRGSLKSTVPKNPPIICPAAIVTRKREMINEQLISALAAMDIHNVEKNKLRRHIITAIDRSRFTYLKNDSKIISDHYFREVIKYAFYSLNKQKLF